MMLVAWVEFASIAVAWWCFDWRVALVWFFALWAIKLAIRFRRAM